LLARRDAALRFVLFFLLALALQWRSHAYRAEFGATLDEPAHYVTGLMTHDYLVSGFHEAPLAFAREYYLHYPKVAMGHWPPFFYALQALWTIPFGVSATSVLMLMALLSALLALLVCEILRAEFDSITGLVAAIVLLTLPAVAEFSSEVMAEIPMALVVLLAVRAYGRYLDTMRWRYAIQFGVFASLGLLTKGTGVELAMVPPLAVVLGRRWRLPGRASFWFPAVLVLAIAGPWYFWVPGANHSAVEPYGGINFIVARFVDTITTWWKMLSPLPWMLAAAGAIVVAMKTPREKPAGIWTAGFSVLLGAYLLRPLIDVWEPRHLISTVPVLMLFAAAGAHAMAGVHAILRRAVVRRACAAAGLLIVLIPNIRAIPPKPEYGYRDIARTVAADPALKNTAILVCCNPLTEGVFVSEIAMHEIRPGHFVLRASKLLASVDWSGLHYRQFYERPDEMMAALNSLPVSLVILGPEWRDFPHGRVLFEALTANPPQWPALPSRNNVTLFRSANPRLPGKIRLPQPIGGFGTIESQ
jgi:hypothetical protein